MIATGRPTGSPTWLLLLAAVTNAAAAALTLLVPDILNGPAVMNGSARGTALIMLVLGSSADPSSSVATMGAVYIFVVLAVIGTVVLAYYVRSLRHEPAGTVAAAIT